MKKKHQRPPIHVYPPFPSFAWVMTTQANPPLPAYAYGYVQSAHAHNGPHPHPHPRLPAYRHAARARHQPHSHARSTRTSPTPPRSSPRVARTKAATKAHDEKLMECVDYRYHDPPSRPYVPWHEGYTLRGRGAQQPRHVHHHRHHRHQRQQHALPPAAFAVATPPSAPPSEVDAADSKRGFPGCSDDSDDDDEAFVRREKATTVDIVKIRRLDIMLNALCRACKSKIAAK